MLFLRGKKLKDNVSQVLVRIEVENAHRNMNQLHEVANETHHSKTDGDSTADLSKFCSKPSTFSGIHYVRNMFSNDLFSLASCNV
jgi:hypothetical protein